jgi:lysophospholipase L1-like esterase
MTRLGFVVALATFVTPALGAPPSKQPVVVLVGDSIRLGYAPVVAEILKDEAEVVSPAENGGDSANVLKHLDEWVVSRKPDVVHFNAGLHDLKTDAKTGAKQVPLDAYRRNLSEIIRRLDRETPARLVFATTTPILDERHKARKSGFDRTEADVAEYNRVAREVASGNPIVAVDDLHALVTRLGPDHALLADGTHYTPEAYRALGEQVAASIRKALHEPEATLEAVCRRTPVPVVVTGTVEDVMWDLAEPIERFPAFWRNVPSRGDTSVRLLWDDNYLYFGAFMKDSELRTFGHKRNDTIWEGDVLEIFLKPSDDRPEYYEFQVNPRSIIVELPFTFRGEDFKKVASRPTMGMTAVSHCDGTADTPGDADHGWSVSGRIPWKAFGPTGGRPKPGDVWKFAICRYDYGAPDKPPFMMSSAPLRRPSFHRYEDYGRLRFEGLSGAK